MQLKHRPALDGLRAIAVLAVILFHIAYIATGADLSLPIIHDPILVGGALGVDVFYALSGFLITTILINEADNWGRVSLFNFYMRRSLRLVPALSITVIGCGIYLMFANTELSPKSLIYAATYMTSLAPLIETGNFVHEFGMLIHTWSLSVEEHFYLVWPISLIFLLRLSRQRMALVVASLAIALFIVRIVMGSSGNAVALNIAFFTLIGRGGELLAGCFVSIVCSTYSPSRIAASALKVATGIAFVVLCAILAFCEDSVLGGPAVASLTAIIIAGLVINPPLLLDRFLSSQVMTGIGRASYGLYLYHVPVFLLMPPTTSLMGTSAIFLSAIGISFLLSIASFEFIERPVLKLKKRYSTERASLTQSKAVVLKEA